jgi:hypothetical protein
MTDSENCSPRVNRASIPRQLGKIVEDSVKSCGGIVCYHESLFYLRVLEPHWIGGKPPAFSGL